MCLCYLHGDVHGFGGHSALVGIVTCHHDVTILAPGGSPTVLENPVILAFACGTIAYD